MSGPITTTTPLRVVIAAASIAVGDVLDYGPFEGIKPYLWEAIRVELADDGTIQILLRCVEPWRANVWCSRCDPAATRYRVPRVALREVSPP